MSIEMFCTACYVDVLSYVFRAYTVTMGKVARAGSLFSSKLDGNGKHWHSCILQWLKDSACYTRLCLQEVSIPFALVDISLSMNPIQKKRFPRSANIKACLRCLCSTSGWVAYWLCWWSRGTIAVCSMGVWSVQATHLPFPLSSIMLGCCKSD